VPLSALQKVNEAGQVLKSTYNGQKKLVDLLDMSDIHRESEGLFYTEVHAAALVFRSYESTALSNTSVPMVLHVSIRLKISTHMSRGAEYSEG